MFLEADINLRVFQILFEDGWLNGPFLGAFGFWGLVIWTEWDDLVDGWLPFFISHVARIAAKYTDCSKFTCWNTWNLELLVQFYSNG